MSTRNTLQDLNDHLFMELERLGDEELDEETLKVEIERARAIAGVADKVIANANTVLRAAQFKEGALAENAVPRMLGA